MQIATRHEVLWKKKCWYSESLAKNAARRARSTGLYVRIIKEKEPFMDAPCWAVYTCKKWLKDKYGREYQVYYHVVPKTYKGGDLLCRDELEFRGIPYIHKWDMLPRDYQDGDLVCLFDTLEDARYYLDEWEPGGKILKIKIYPEEMELTENDEGYTCVYNTIPEEFIAGVVK